MAGPLPAKCTPLRVEGNPSHNLRMARSVAKPIPAGIPSSQSRNFHARQRWKASGSFGCEQRLRNKECVFSVVADHPATEEKSVSPLAVPAALDALTGH